MSLPSWRRRFDRLLSGEVVAGSRFRRCSQWSLPASAGYQRFYPLWRMPAAAAAGLPGKRTAVRESRRDEMPGRSANVSANIVSVLAWSISFEKVSSDNRAEWFSATRRITAKSSLPTRMSVTGSVMPERPEIASRWAWLFVLAISTRSNSASRQRLHQDRPGDRDVVVARELVDDGGRRIANRRQAIGQFGARLGSNLGDQPRQHVVEQADVILVEAAGAFQKVRREALERLRPAARASHARQPLRARGSTRFERTFRFWAGLGGAVSGAETNRGNLKERLVNPRLWIVSPLRGAGKWLYSAHPFWIPHSGRMTSDRSFESGPSGTRSFLLPARPQT